MDMHVHQMHHQLVEQMSHVLTAPRLRTVVISVVGLAGLIHLALIREHFAEQFVYGLVFTALALFQLALALLLAVWPGPRVYRVGIWGSGLIVLVYVLTRLIPLPGASAPEEVDALGIAATLLELAAVLLLAIALPEPATTHRPHGAPVWWGIGGAVVFALLWLILTGVMQWTGAVSPPALTWAGTDSWSALTPILVGLLLPHIWLAAPWWSLPAVLVLAVLVGFNLWLSTSMLLVGALSRKDRRTRLLALLPAGLAAPVCCSASTPLLALLGVPLFLGVIAAPFAALLSAILLSLSLVLLRVRFSRVTCVQASSRMVGAVCDTGSETEQGNVVPFPRVHPGRRLS